MSSPYVKTVYDYRRDGLKSKGYFGRESEMLLAYANDRGASSRNVFDGLLQFLRLNGAESNNIEDAWDEIYIMCDLKGSRQEQEIAFWRDLNGEIPIRAIVGWTCRGICDE